MKKKVVIKSIYRVPIFILPTNMDVLFKENEQQD